MTRLTALLLCLPFVGTAATLATDAAPRRQVKDSPLAGGEVTVFNTSKDAFARPAPNLPVASLRDFTFGNKMFNTNWVTPPASVTSLDGLGPTFNRVSCSACHFKDGRGRPPIAGEDSLTSMLIRLSIKGQAEVGGPFPHPAYGGQLNDRAIHGVPAEGRVRITYEEIPGHYADGTPYSLRRPSYHFEEMAFGPLGKDALFSPRVAPAVFGMGLLEAIPETTLQGWADPEDQDGDGISGRLNRVWDEPSQTTATGRFGWKANVDSLHHQDAGAALGDMGITTSLFPKQNCPEPQTACRSAPYGGEPEMSDKQLEKLVFYTRTLAVPARRHLDDPDVQLGARLFEKNHCASCHKPSVRTGEHAVEALAFQEIQPFSDLLLHDMGEELADQRPDFEATGREWRTPPLWGIGLTETVNGHSYFLHDGRARNLEEAILWHGGEAEKSKEAFRRLSQKERAALIAFLSSL